MKKLPIGVLTDFRVIRPRFEKRQVDTLGWLAQAHAYAEARNAQASVIDIEVQERMARLFRRFGCGADKIALRGFDVSDMDHQDFSAMEIYGSKTVEGETVTAPYGQGIHKRMQYYKNSANNALTRFYREEQTPPEHLIHVTCTGYVSPSPAQELVNEKRWHGKTNVTQAYHMGCYAALPAVRMAEGFVAANTERVDIVHNELCSLHMNPLDHSPEQLVVYSLFADGHIRYSMLPFSSQVQSGFDVLAVREELIADSLECMSWVPSEWGMKMSLAKEVPERIGHSLDGFLRKMFADLELDYSNAGKECSFAIHPGGPRIIDSIQKLASLRDDQVAHSREVLLNCGNMSSATLPHIWSAMVNDSEIPSGQLVVSLAFGPGLTIFGALLRKR